MKKEKGTKRSLLMSALALVLCFSMLIGSTFAWFTDSVTSAGNKIVAGNLDVDLYLWTSADGEPIEITNESAPIFGEGSVAQNNNAQTLWEPGKTQVAYLSIKNNGNLDLKYQVAVEVQNVAKDLYEVMEYAITPDAQYGEVEAWTTGTSVAVGTNATQANDVQLKRGEEHFFALSVHMLEEAGNDYMDGQVNFDIKVLATQLASELGSFGPDYDAEATYPTTNAVYVPADTTEATPIKAGEVTAYVPAGAAEGWYELKVTNKNVSTQGAQTAVSFDISLYKDGQKVSGVMYPVELQLEALKQIVSLTHNGDAITAYDYDAMTGILSFQTDSVSPFAVTYMSVGEDIQVEEGKIVSGVFVGKNPAELDPTLAENDSKYIAVSYEKGGETCYVVAERATTIVLKSYDSSYTPVNTNYTVTTVAQSGLAPVLHGRNGADFTTFYLLPGTYEEDAVLSVQASMDIIGLGNAEDIKVIKVKGESSHRHLFNVSGATTRSEHIQVTIKNLYLDANAKNKPNATSKLYTMNNGAVQAIRLAKVKCIDLIVDKSSGIPFYVNGRYHEDGTYMYVENTVVTGTANPMIDTADPYLFYYNGLTYNNGANTYTNADAFVKNTPMAADDWTWD